MTSFLEQFRANPSRGVVTSARLDHWHKLLEAWCTVHELFCCIAEGDAIWWHTERSNVGALAGAAWRIGWAALEEFGLDKVVKRRAANGRGDLFLQSDTAHDYVEAKHVCGQFATAREIVPVRLGIHAACSNAEEVTLDEEDKRIGVRRIGVVFAAPDLGSGSQPLPDAFEKLIETLQGRYDLDAVAWCFPKLKQKLCWDDGGESPGLFLLAMSVD